MRISSDEPSDLIAAVRSKRIRYVKMRIEADTYDEEQALPTVVERLMEELDDVELGGSS